MREKRKDPEGISDSPSKYRRGAVAVQVLARTTRRGGSAALRMRTIRNMTIVIGDGRTNRNRQKGDSAALSDYSQTFVPSSSLLAPPYNAFQHYHYGWLTAPTSAFAVCGRSDVEHPNTHRQQRSLRSMCPSSSSLLRPSDAQDLSTSTISLDASTTDASMFVLSIQVSHHCAPECGELPQVS